MTKQTTDIQKINDIVSKSTDGAGGAAAAEKLRSMFVGMADDWRVVVPCRRERPCELTAYMRNAYLLTTNPDSDRTKFAQSVLERIGFRVIFYLAVKHDNKVLSNKQSMQGIYRKILEGTDEWSYVFEDDINIMENISLQQIADYEGVANKIIYLGLCRYGDDRYLFKTEHVLDGHPVYRTSGHTRCLHAIGLSQDGCRELLDFSLSPAMAKKEYMDFILENFTFKNPATVVRYDLESYDQGHRGIIFQDRKNFPSSIS